MKRKSVRRTLSEFLEDAYEKYNDKFDYNKVTEYKNRSQIICIRCIKHNHWFNQSIEVHLKKSKHACPLCRKEFISLKTRKPFAQFVIDAKMVHGDLYIYDNVNYINDSTKIEIHCWKGHIFYQRPNDHLRPDTGTGCPECNGKLEYTKENFNRRFIEKFGNTFDLSKVNFVDMFTPIIIGCINCGFVTNEPRYFLNSKNGCTECFKNIKMTLEDFIKRSNDIHDNRYDYPESDVNGDINSKTIITCSKLGHGDFPQSRKEHMRGAGCPKCASQNSKGEMNIAKMLNENEIKYSTQYVFDKCKHKRKLPFDFKLDNINLCIEFDGIFHYTVERFYTNEEKRKEMLQLTQLRDKIKTEYCKTNNIILYRIPYFVPLKPIMNKIIKHIKIKLMINDILSI
jgi:hypothetical protein